MKLLIVGKDGSTLPFPILAEIFCSIYLPLIKREKIINYKLTGFKCFKTLGETDVEIFFLRIINCFVSGIRTKAKYTTTSIGMFLFYPVICVCVFFFQYDSRIIYHT